MVPLTLKGRPLALGTAFVDTEAANDSLTVY